MRYLAKRYGWRLVTHLYALKVAYALRLPGRSRVAKSFGRAFKRHL